MACRLKPQGPRLCLVTGCLPVLLLLSGCSGGGSAAQLEATAGPESPHAGCLRLANDDSVDGETGTSVVRYSVPSGHVHGGYFAGTLAVSRDNFFFVCDSGGGANLYHSNSNHVSAVTEFDGIDVFSDANFFGSTPYRTQNSLFFAFENSVYSYDVLSGVTRQVFRPEDGLYLWAPLYATADGRWLSFTVSNRNADNPLYFLARVDALTGQVVMRDSPFTGTDKPIANHVQVNPFDPDTVLFAHEGRSVQDRIWLWKVSSGEVVPVYQQELFVEWGHEHWTPDGTAIYVVQYGDPSRAIESAFHVLSPAGELLSSFATNEFNFNHAAMAPGGTEVVIDTFRQETDGQRWLLHLDLVTGTTRRIYPIDSSSNPAHGHPSWAEDGTAVFFNDWIDGRIELLRWLPE